MRTSAISRSNRTIVGLKLEFLVTLEYIRQGSNRTIVGLKPVSASTTLILIVSSNRTIVGLKRGRGNVANLR